ncbi:MCE family protein [Rhodobacteraceae bacterium NNCM2]|nr:MCE family protein [Coraliihabitans acroporae]
MTDQDLDVPEPRVEKMSSGRWPSLVWLVPLVAVIGAVVLLVENIATRGPLITIELTTAAGLVAGETPVKYRDVTVGQVEAIRFSDDLKHVIVSARMSREVAPYLDASATFWVVTPQVTAQGISGLETVLSGSYIEGSWDTEPGEELSHFVATDTPPPTPKGTPGIRIVLRAEDGGSLDVGSPIFFKRVQVGHVESKQLNEDGSAVIFKVFINAPNDKRINKGTRFWNVSGVDLELGADGAHLHIASLSSLLRGGASFDTIEPNKGPVEAEEEFRLYVSETAARDNVVSSEPQDRVTFEILFDGSVRGLRANASVEYRGIRIGRVESVTAAVDPETNRFRTRTRIGITPASLGLPEGDKEAVMSFIRAAVANGLRAKLAMGNILTGALYVNFEDVRNPAPATLDESGAVPRLPAVASDIEELTGSVEGVLDRVNDLPIEALMANAVELLENINKLVTSESTQAIPKEAVDVLVAARELIAAPELRKTTQEAEALVSSLRAMVEDPALGNAPEQLGTLIASLSALAEELERADAAGNLAATLVALRAIAEDPKTAALPGEINAALTAATTLLASPELVDLPGQINLSLATLRDTLQTPGIAELPGDLRKALASLQARLDDPGLVQATAEIGPLIGEARTTLTSLSNDIDPLIASLREILDDPATRATPGELEKTLAAARALLEDDGLKAAAGEAAPTLAALRALLEAPGTKAAPEELNATLNAAKALLVSMEEARAAENLSETLAAARRLIDNPSLLRASDELASTLAAMRAVLVAPGMEQLPAATTEALYAAALLIEQFQRENLGNAAAGALTGIEEASAAVTRSVANIPALLARLTEVARRADSLLASVDVGSELNYEAVAAIREIRDAARAVTDLADLVQQKPNAIILGK